MARSSLLDTIGESRRITVLHEEDGKNYIESKQDCEPLIEWMSQRRDRPQDPEFHLIGIIPETVLNQAFLEGWFHDVKAWKKWLNDNDKLRFSSQRI